MFLAIRALATAVYASVTFVFAIFNAASWAVSVVIFNSISFGE